MAQLKDDCFATGGELTPLDEALDDLARRIKAVTGVESVSLRQARGRLLAEDLTSPRDVPPHDNSAVDGFAVYFDDLGQDRETRLPVTGRIAAGHPLGRAARRGEAVQIFTGAVMPAGTKEGGGPDTIFMLEDCETDGGDVILPAGLKRGANRRFRGEDVKQGGIMLRAGHRLRAQDIGLAASVGKAELAVRARLRVAVFSTGDEVRDPEGEAPEGCIFDSNRYAVMALLEGLGCQVTDLGILADEAAAIAGALDRAAADHDLLVTSGGVSLGEEDHVKEAVESLGSLHMWRLAIKPGRPIALGQVKGTAFIGLPGNPVAAMVTFMRIGRPVVCLLSGRRDWAPVFFPVQAGFDYKKKTGRREWVRVRLAPADDAAGDGLPVARKHPSGGAGVLTSLVESDGLVELPEAATDLKAGTTVNFLPFAEVMT